MECNRVREELTDYIDGKLPKEEADAIRAHIYSCQECSGAYSDLQKTVQYIKGLEQVDPPAWLTQQVMAKVREESEKKGLWEKVFYPLHIKLPLEAAATLLIALTALYVFKSTDQEMKVAEVMPGEVRQERLQKEETLPRKEPRSAEKKDRPAFREKTDTELPGATPPAATKEDIAMQPPRQDRSEQSQVLPQSSPVPPRPLAAAPPAPSGQPGKNKETAAEGVEVLAESRIKDETRVRGRMMYAAPQEKEELKKGPAAAAPAMKKSAAVAGSRDNLVLHNITLILDVADSDKSVEETRKVLSGLGGQEIRTETSGDMIIVTAGVEKGRLRELTEKLGKTGELRKKELPPDIPEGIVNIRIEIIRTAKR